MFEYLGIPISGTKPLKKNFDKVISRAASRIYNWTSLYLSLAGRIILIGSVLQSFHVFMLSFTAMPTGISRAGW